MNDEIKELIEELKDCYGIAMPKQEYFGDIKGIEDYITNLEEELEEYKDTETYSKRFLYKANKDRLNANLELLQENERLKTKAKEQSLLLIDYQDMEQKLENYKSRIEKAVEYIEQYDGHIEGYYYSKEHKRFLVEENVKDELLNILNGRSDE